MMRLLFTFLMFAYTNILQYIHPSTVADLPTYDKPAISRKLRAPCVIDHTGMMVKRIVEEITNHYYGDTISDRIFSNSNISFQIQKPVLKPVRAYMEVGLKETIYKIKIQERMPSDKCSYKVYIVVENKSLYDKYSFVDVEPLHIPCIMKNRLRGGGGSGYY